MAVEQIFIGSVFIAGFMSFFAPCTFALIPVYIGILTDNSKSKRRARIYGFEIKILPILKTMTFVLGLSTAFVSLGFGAGSIGFFISSRHLIRVGGFLVILLGLHQAGILRIKQLEKYKRLKINPFEKNNILGSYALGLTFSFGWTPCVGPVLGAVLLVSATEGAFYGGYLMMVYSIGLMIPFLILSLFSSALIERMKIIESHLETIKKAGGVLIIIMGILLITNSLNILTGIIERL